MKVCLVADALEPLTGWGRYAGEIARGLIAAGVQCRLVSPISHCSYPDLASHSDHRDLRSFMYGDRHWAKLLFRVIPTLYRASADCDLVHCFVEPYLPNYKIGIMHLAAGLWKDDKDMRLDKNVEIEIKTLENKTISKSLRFIN